MKNIFLAKRNNFNIYTVQTSCYIALYIYTEERNYSSINIYGTSCNQFLSVPIQKYEIFKNKGGAIFMLFNVYSYSSWLEKYFPY